MPDPIVVGAVAVGALSVTGRTPEESEVITGSRAPMTPISSVEGWIYPVARWRGIAPVISDGPGIAKRDGGKRDHNGVDICLPRKRGEFPEYKPGTHEGSPGGLYFCPTGQVKVLAAYDGVLWSCKATSRGISVTIDHGRPYATFYQHLSSTKLPLAASGTNKMRIRAGQEIGVVGFDPTGGDSAFNHLHFEIWKDGGSDAWIDPTAILSRASVLLV